ncbi:hypothetical protein FGIG_06112 [Fasciola gigantica]|uniref:Uncharacterized protein n=1 Tax=Fasciola gigantica TaxID=46835 RepID=A0A504Z130_FASGI|nr:hypothetical protein FGIG_06112 [Fasciola gigantica]
MKMLKAQIQSCFFPTFPTIHSFMIVTFLTKISFSAPLSNFSTIMSMSLEPGLQLRVLEQFTSLFGTSLTNPPLFTDINMDGNTDVILATMDGTVRAYSFAPDGFHTNNSPSRPSGWSCPIHGENFASSPVLVHLDEKGHGLIVVVSVRGVIYALDGDGVPLVQIQIPDLVLDAQSKLDLFARDLRSLMTTHLHWFDSANNVQGVRLSPRVYTTPLAPLINLQFPLMDPQDADALIVPVNFAATDLEDSADFIVATLIGVPRRLFLSTHLWGSSIGRVYDLSIQVLEFGWLREAQPPYLFASPTIIANPNTHWIANGAADVSSGSNADVRVPPNLSGSLTYRILIPSFSGRLHSVALPLAKIDRLPMSARDISYSFSTPFAQSPVLTDCSGLTGSVANSSVCCLLLDTESRLLLLSLSVHKYSSLIEPSRMDTSLMWTYIPQVPVTDSAPVVHKDQVGQVIVVRCGIHNGQPDRWAVYPTPDGWLHAVNMSTGKPVLDYPLRVIEKQSGVDVTFSMGPGMLYSAPDAHTWMLLSDTGGVFYQVRMCCPKPVVVRTAARSPHGFRVSNVWHMPTALVHLDEKDVTISSSGNVPSISAFLLSTEGISLLVPNSSLVQSTLTDHIDISAHPRLLASKQDLVYFIDPTTGRAVDSIHLESDQRVVHYRIHDCPDWAPNRMNFSDNQDIHHVPTAFVAQLVDSLGTQLSDWSVARLQLSSGSSSDSITSPVTCGGALTISRPLYGSFRTRIHLLVVDRRTGLLRTPSGVSFSPNVFAATALLDVETLWPQLLTVWTYLPILYLFAGLVIVHTSRISNLQFRHNIKLPHSA